MNFYEADISLEAVKRKNANLINEHQLSLLECYGAFKSFQREITFTNFLEAFCDIGGKNVDVKIRQRLQQMILQYSHSTM